MTEEHPREEAEDTTTQDAEMAYYYARYVIDGRWPEAEAAISQDAKQANNYAQHVIKGRFPEAEAAIASDSFLDPACVLCLLAILGSLVALAVLDFAEDEEG